MKRCVYIILSLICLIQVNSVSADLLRFAARGVRYAKDAGSPYINKGAQDNTLDALIYAAQRPSSKVDPVNGLDGSELSVMVTDKDDIVLCHDEDLTDLTGKPTKIKKLKRAEIEELSLSTTIPANGGKKAAHYDKPRKFEFLPDVFRYFAKEYWSKGSSFQFWFSIKDPSYRPAIWKRKSNTARVLARELPRLRQSILKEYPDVDIYKHLMISSTNPFIVQELITLSKEVTKKLNKKLNQNETGVEKLIGFDYSPIEKVVDCCFECALDMTFLERVDGLCYAAVSQELAGKRIPMLKEKGIKTILYDYGPDQLTEELKQSGYAILVEP